MSFPLLCIFGVQVAPLCLAALEQFHLEGHSFLTHKAKLNRSLVSAEVQHIAPPTRILSVSRNRSAVEASDADSEDVETVVEQGMQSLNHEVEVGRQPLRGTYSPAAIKTGMEGAVGGGRCARLDSMPALDVT